MGFHLLQTVLNRRSIKKISTSFEAPIPPEPIEEAHSEYVELLLSTAFQQKGSPEICAQCGSSVVGVPYINDSQSEHSVCINCVHIEMHCEFTDWNDTVWIPFADARIFNASGEEITTKVKDRTRIRLGALETAMYSMFNGKFGATSKEVQQSEVDYKTLLNAIDMALDLRCKDDFIDLTNQYNSLRKGETEDEV